MRPSKRPSWWIAISAPAAFGMPIATTVCSKLQAVPGSTSSRNWPICK
eukprot:CAMPEP_0182834186 /NCGR_PEP_ID=MMETSP0006_2-20121128/20769_2 /TAXON_ID=97485 /ORGANISM="Prymnesium parvum, Strain Texoma1" /LENGTH=47 /DNA_ID= /DNA_START= /DNA_END= /DNA_ORIENTATION=